MESNSTAFLIKIKLRHSLGKPSRSDFVQSEFVGIDILENIVKTAHLRDDTNRVTHVKERFFRHFTFFDKVKLSKRQTNYRKDVE